MLSALIKIYDKKEGLKNMNRNSMNDPLESNTQNAMQSIETQYSIYDMCSNLSLFYENLNKASFNISNIDIYQFTKSSEKLLKNNTQKNTYAVLVFDIDQLNEFNNSIKNELIAHIESTLKNYINEPKLYCNMNDGNYVILLENYKSIDIALLVILLTEEISDYIPELNIKPTFGICIADQSDQNIPSLYKRAFYAKSTIKGQNQKLLANYTELILRKHNLSRV